jgi:hypothetical protein
MRGGRGSRTSQTDRSGKYYEEMGGSKGADNEFSKTRNQPRYSL